MINIPGTSFNKKNEFLLTFDVESHDAVIRTLFFQITEETVKVK